MTLKKQITELETSCIGLQDTIARLNELLEQVKKELVASNAQLYFAEMRVTKLINALDNFSDRR